MTPAGVTPRGMKVSDGLLREMAISHAARLVIDGARRSGVIRPDEGPPVNAEESMEIIAYARDRGLAASLERALTEAAALMERWHDHLRGADA